MNPEGGGWKSELNNNLDLPKFLSDLSKGKIVLEIGGDLPLTEELVRKAKKVYVIEKDEELSGKLRKMGAQVIVGDASKVEWPQFQVLLSTLPSLIGELLLFKMTRYDFEFAVLVVSERLHRKMSERGKIGLLIDEFFEVERLRAFSGLKRVVVKLKRKRTNTLFSKVLLQYDKKLKNALREALCSFGLTKREARFLARKLGLGELGEKRVTELTDKSFLVLSKKLEEPREEVSKPQ